MQEEFRTTLKLIREHPLLLAPLVASCWLAHYLQWFQKAATHYVLHRFLIGHSVLGVDIPNPDPTYAYVHKAMIVMAPFGFVITFLLLALSVAAFVLTAHWVRTLHTRKRMAWRDAARFLASRKWHLARFTLASQVALYAATSLVAMLMPLFAPHLEHPFQMVQASAYIIFALYAWIALPFALRLIAEPTPQPIPAHTKLEGRCAALAAFLLMAMLAEVVKSASGQINLSTVYMPAVRSHLVWPLIRTFSSLPLAALWIFLAVLLYEKGETATASPSME